jgi:hypothetical protein
MKTKFSSLLCLISILSFLLGGCGAGVDVVKSVNDPEKSGDDPELLFPGYCAYTGQLPSVLMDDWSNPDFKCCVDKSLCTGGPHGKCYFPGAPESQICNLTE